MATEPPAGWEQRGEEGADAGLSAKGASTDEREEITPTLPLHSSKSRP